MVKATRRTIPGLVERREDFEGSNIFANTYPEGPLCGTGRLGGVDLDTWNANRKQIRYVVFSYYTPIAWTYADGNTHRVAQKFSVTTSKQMGLLYTL